MDLPTFTRVERITGSIAPVDSNPTEPTRPGTMHYLATLYRDGRSFATHVSAPVGEHLDLPDAIRVAAERARRVEESVDREEWRRVAGLQDALAMEVDLWHRAQQAEAQALRAFLGEVAYRQLLEITEPLPPSDLSLPADLESELVSAVEAGERVRRRAPFVPRPGTARWVALAIGSLAIGAALVRSRQPTVRSGRRSSPWRLRRSRR